MVCWVPHGVAGLRGNVPQDLSIPPPEGEDNFLSSSVNTRPRNSWDPENVDFPNGTVAESEEVKRYKVASFDFNHVATPYIISLWIIIVGLAKIGNV